MLNPPCDAKSEALGGVGTMEYTCGGCATVWSGVSRCHCSRCHRTFSGAHLFDRHQVRGACVDPAVLPGPPVELRDGIWRSAEVNPHWSA